MMKVKITMRGGRALVLLGLSFANLEQLRRDALDGFIKIDGAELGVPVDIMITAAKDERALLDAFGKYAHEGTDVRIDARLKS